MDQLNLHKKKQESPKVNGVIYKAVNLINGKAYIGKTVVSLASRKAGHLFNAYSPSKSSNPNSALSRALLKYGKDAFVWEIIDRSDNEQLLNQLEIVYIKIFNSIAPNGYNLTVGGDGRSGHVFTEASKKKISESLSGPNHPRFGLFGKDNPLFGRKHSEETKLKISRPGKSNPNFGKKLSIEQREQIRKTNTGKKQSKETIQKRIESFGHMVAVKAINLTDGSENFFRSMGEAAKSLGVNGGNIHRIIKNGKGKTGNYTFKKINKENK